MEDKFHMGFFYLGGDIYTLWMENGVFGKLFDLSLV